MDALLKPLISTNSRITPARKNIYLIFRRSKSPLTPNDVMDKVRVNKTTVYREIDFLIKNKLITGVSFGDGQLRYESTLLGHHHHLICLKCHKVNDTRLDGELFDLERKIKNQNNFSVTRHNLEFFGYCESCQN